MQRPQLRLAFSRLCAQLSLWKRARVELLNALAVWRPNRRVWPAMLGAEPATHSLTTPTHTLRKPHAPKLKLKPLQQN